MTDKEAIVATLNQLCSVGGSGWSYATADEFIRILRQMGFALVNYGRNA